MKRVAILLATYNGCRYLETLLNSLFNQSFTEFNIFIHDDNSMDGTVSYVKEFIKGKNNVFILEDNCNRGAKASFMWLLEKVEADYYMFCDQDDLWLPNKIEQSVEKLKELEEENPNKPICIHTDLAVADANYNIVSKSLWKQSRVKPAILEDKDYIQVFNCVTGCTLIFNQLAKECALPMNDLAPMHDFWVVYKTLDHGGILTHLPYSTMLYCQHGNNEVGANDVGYYYVFYKLKHIKKIIQENVEKYQVMHQISGISWRRYLYCKVSYEIRRLL